MILKKIKKSLAILALSSLAILPLNSFAGSKLFIGIATGGTGGTYYPLGGMLAQLLSNKAKVSGTRIIATAETANGSVSNSKLLGREKIETAFVAADILRSAYLGKKQFKGKPIKNLRVLGALYPETLQIVVLKSSPIKSFADLKGRSVSPGSPGSGQWQIFTEMLKAYGMKQEDVKIDYSSFSQSIDKMKDGNLDAAFVIAGTPTSSITELSRARDIRIINVYGKEIDEVIKKLPLFAYGTMPKNTYKGQTKDVKTLNIRTTWVATTKMSNEVAYQLVKTLYENTETLGKVHPKGKEIHLKNALDSISTPVHPGALKYYKEKGLVK